MAKLTLSVDGSVVKTAKRYARRHGTSVSHLVEQYLGLVALPPIDPVTAVAWLAAKPE
jgi:hypothetical protein